MNPELLKCCLEYFRGSFEWIDYSYHDLADWEKEIFTKEQFEQLVILVKKS